MMELRLKDCRLMLRESGVIRPPAAGLYKIRSSTLRALMIGAPEQIIPAAFSARRGVSALISRLVNHAADEAPLGPIVIDGHYPASGKDGQIKIISDTPPERPTVVGDPYAHRRIDLRKVCAANGNALSPLVLRNLRIRGVLDMSEAHFAAIEIDNCELRGITGDGVRIDGDCLFTAIRPFGVPRTRPTLEEMKPQRFAQIRMVAARIAGALDIRGALLRAPDYIAAEGANGPRGALALAADTVIDELTETQELPPGRFADQFALSLATAKIDARLMIANGIEAWGGISLYQATIARSVSIAIHHIAARNTEEPPASEEQNGKTIIRALRNYAALDAMEVTVGGSLRLTGPIRLPGVDDWNIAGRVLLLRAAVAGDVYFRNCRWKSRKITLSPRHPDIVRLFDTGGIDARYIRVEGQFRIDGASIIGRRRRPNTGLRDFNAIGSAIDLWKAHLGLGLRIESRAEIHGPVYCNDASIKRHISIAGSFILNTESDVCPRNSPYHTAIDFAGTRLEGEMVLDLTAADGRLSLLGMTIDGSLEIKKIPFRYYPAKEPEYVPEIEPANPRHEAQLEKGKGLAFVFDETSILDLQDLKISGGINIKREAVSLEYGTLIPNNNVIVDFRGMSCTTWDDAEATCWDGLIGTEAKKRTPWRIRFEGISFGHLDSSSQMRVIKRKTTMKTFSLTRGWMQRIIERVFSRTHMAIGSDEVRRFRLRALQSFHDNRNRERLAVLHSRGGTRLSRAVSALTSFRVLATLVRWTFQKSWHRRELIPAFSPQPYEMFAKAYVQRGDVDVGIWIAQRKLRLHWRRRSRSFSQDWRWLWLLGLATLCSLYWHWWWPLRDIFAVVQIALAGLTLIPPLLMIGTTSLFGLCFGYGLSTKRSILTLMAYVVLAGFLTPVIVDNACTGRHETWSSVLTRLYYGVDKLIPVIDLDAKLFMTGFTPTQRCVIAGKHYPSGDRRSQAQRDNIIDPPNGHGNSTADQVGVSVNPTELPAFDRVPLHPVRYYLIDRLLNLFGWIILSIAALTWSGLLRRDLERN